MSYKKKYIKHMGFAEQETILCPMCYRTATEVHHILFKSQNGTDEMSNLIHLCRNCHVLAHSNKEFNNELKEIRKQWK